MSELRRPLSRLLDSPGLLVQRLKGLLPKLDPRPIDLDYLLASMAETDHNYYEVLNYEELPKRSRRAGMEDEARQS
jgi:hypothetical protein